MKKSDSDLFFYYSPSTFAMQHRFKLSPSARLQFAEELIAEADFSAPQSTASRSPFTHAPYLSSLKVLHLQNQEIRDSIQKSLNQLKDVNIEPLSPMPHLLSLDLPFHQIGEEGAFHLSHLSDTFLNDKTEATSSLRQ
jgi:hypothetical protein